MTITRKPKAVDPIKQRAEAIASAHHFDNGDGSFERRKAVIASNLTSLSVVMNPATATPKAAPQKVKVKAKPKQTKRPSDAKAEAEGKSKKKKVAVAGKKSPAAARPPKPHSNKVQSKPRRKQAGGGGGGGGRPKPKPVKEHITARWAKMSPAAKASYIQSRAGRTIKTADADEAMGKIWNRMSLAQQKAHLRRHPDTRLKLGDKKSRSDQTDPQKPRNAPSDSHMDAAQLSVIARWLVIWLHVLMTRSKKRHRSWAAISITAWMGSKRGVMVTR